MNILTYTENVLPLWVRAGLHPANAGGLPCVGVRASSSGRSNWTNPVSPSIHRSNAGEW